MPILVAVRRAQPPIVVPPVPVFSWTSPAGRRTELANFGGDDSGVMVMPGSIGLGMPDYGFYEDRSPGFDGSSVRGLRAEPRDISLPLHLWGSTREELLGIYHQLVMDLNPRTGPGTLTLTSHTGTARTIEAYYAGGLTGQDDDRTWALYHISVVLALKCPSPYWLGEEVSYTFTIAQAGGGTFLPILPLEVGDSQVLGEITVENTGDASAFPVFTLAGPADSVTLTNSTTGETLTVDHALIEGDELVIDTRDRVKTVRLNGSTNLYPDLTGTMWPLVQGTNELDLEVPGATEDTSLTVSYQQRFLTAY